MLFSIAQNSFILPVHFLTGWASTQLLSASVRLPNFFGAFFTLVVVFLFMSTVAIGKHFQIGIYA